MSCFTFTYFSLTKRLQTIFTLKSYACSLKHCSKFPNNDVNLPGCFCLKSTLSFMAPLLSFPAGLITKVPEERNSKKNSQNHHPIQYWQYLGMTNTVCKKFIPFDALPVLLSERLSEVAPSFSDTSAEMSDSFFPVCLATVAGFLKYVNISSFLKYNYKCGCENCWVHTTANK